MKGHEEINKLLVGFVLGELSGQEERQVKAHVAECAECSSELKRLEALLEYTDQMRELSADSQLCETAKEAIFAATGGQEKQLPPNTNINLTFGRRTIMKSRMIKLAAAAVIIIAAGIGIVVFSTLDHGGRPPIVMTRTEELKAELEKVDQLFAARDVRGLERMLLEAKFDKSRVLAANYLAIIGDSNSVEVLQQVYDQCDGTEPAFTEAIAAIQARAAEPDAEEVDGTTPPADVNDAVIGTEAGRTVAEGPDELLELVPAESMFCVRVNNFDYVFGMLDQYLAGISPVPMGATMFARMQLVGVLGDPALNDVNTAGDFAIFGLGSPVEPNENPLDKLFIAALVPVTDYNKFVSNNPSCDQPDANGISVIKAGGALNPNKKMLVASAGGYALLGSADDYAKLLSIAKSVSKTAGGLAASLDSGDVAAATNQPLWAYGNVQRAAQVFGPMVYAQLEQMKTQIEQMNAANQGGPPPAVMNMYYGMYGILTEEVEHLSVSIDPKADIFNVTISTAAVPQTYMAKMFIADTSAAENTLLRYLEDGAIFNVGVRMNTPFMKELSLTNYDLISFLGDEVISDEVLVKIEKLIEDMVSSAGGPGIMSLTHSNQGSLPFAGRYILEIKDEQKWNQVLEDGADLWNTAGFADLYSKMGIEGRYEIKRAADSYNDVPIDLASFAMEPNEPNTFFGTTIDKMYGGGIEYRWAMIDGLWVCAIGADCNSAIRELIDEVKVGGPNEMAPEMSSALATLKDAGKAEFVGTLNLVRYMRMVIHLLQQTNPMGVSLPQIDVSTNSNLAFAGRVSNGKMAVEIALPKEHMLETKAAGEMMGQMFMLMAARQEAISQIPSTGPIIGEPQPGMPTLYTVAPDANLSDEQTLIEGLRTFAEISNGRYPGNLNLIMALKESGEALRKSILEDQNRDPNVTLPTREELVAKLANIEAACLFYDKLVKEGKDVVYRGDKVTTEFPHVVLMQWKISEDQYRVIFADLTAETVTAERLAELEAMPLNLTPKAIKPQPADGGVASSVSELELSWMPGIDAAEHRVYLGTNPDALSLLGGLTSPSGDRLLYVTAAELQADTVYYWRVDEVQADGSIITGDVWSFNTSRLCLWWKFDETSGGSVSDSSGNGYTGMISGENNWNIDGYDGGCLSFDDDTAISVPPEALGSIGRQITISIWLYGYDSTGRNNYVFETGDGNTFLRAAVPDIQNNVVFRAGETDDIVTWNDSSALDWRGSWKHYVFVKDGGILRIYCDGRMVAEKTDASASIRGVRNQPFDIGALVGRQNDYKGKMDDLRIYNYALSGDGIAQIYKGTDATSVEK